MMKSNLLMNFSVDKENKMIKVEREFAARLEKVWSAWTDSRLLDQWWAPKPWQAKTEVMDFREGGYWLYAMMGPEGEKHWSRADYLAVEPLKRFAGHDCFCDENGNINTGFPTSTWDVRFTGELPDSTVVSIEIRFDALSDLEKYIEMGFREGFTAGLENLGELLERI